MKTEKCHLQCVLSIRGWILIACFLSVAACSIGVPSYSRQFIFKEGWHNLDIDVNKTCTYEVGISFSAKANKNLIKDTFGVPTDLKMPALVDLQIENKDRQVLFSKVDFGGSGLGYRYGPNPLKLIAGKVRLVPGNYIVVINVKEIKSDFSGFNTEFFVSGVPKVKCGNKI